MRRAIIFVAVSALLAVGASTLQATVAITHPTTCPGAFLGCPGNGEENSYYLGYLADLFAVFAGLLSLIAVGRVPSKRWHRIIVAAWITTLVLCPLLVVGLVVSILLSTVLPGFGVFGYLAFPTIAAVLMLVFATRWPTRNRV